MLSKQTREMINKYVDENIDDMRFDFYFLDRHRDIKEIENGKFIVQDKDVFIDWSANYKEILRHPIEDFFIPENVNLFVVEFQLDLISPDLIELENFEVNGVIHEEDIAIEDQRFTDDVLLNLLRYTCFDLDYQKRYPDVKTYIDDIYTQKHSENVKQFLERVRPFLCT